MLRFNELFDGTRICTYAKRSLASLMCTSVLASAAPRITFAVETYDENSNSSSCCSFYDKNSPIKKVLVNGKELEFILDDPNHVLPDGIVFNVGVVEPGTNRYRELLMNLDESYEIEHLKFFDITLQKADGSDLEMPLDDAVRLLIEIPNGWDKSDIEVSLVSMGADIQFEEDIIALNDKNYVALWTSHFSPYSVVDIMSNSELEDQSKNQMMAYITVGTTIILLAGFALVMVKRKKKQSESM